MDKQKVFWVVLAVSVFVVVVLIVGVLLLRQHPAGAYSTAVTPMNGNGSQVYEYQRETPLTPPAGTGPQVGTQGTGTTGDQQTMHFYIGEGAPSRTGTAPSAAAPASSAPSTSAPAPSAPAVTAPSVPAVPPAPAVSSAPATVKPRVTRPAAAAAAPKKITQYWIQAGAYKSQDTAEELVKMLDGKGLASRVFSYNLRNETWFRVRVGPYTNRGEAGKFLSLVKQVQGLEGSYISLVAASAPAARNAVN